MTEVAKTLIKLEELNHVWERHDVDPVGGVPIFMLHAHVGAYRVEREPTSSPELPCWRYHHNGKPSEFAYLTSLRARQAAEDHLAARHAIFEPTSASLSSISQRIDELLLILRPSPASPAMTPGMHAVVAERRGQVDREGFTAEHDDRWTEEELAQAAMVYVEGDAENWPLTWDQSWYKPTDRRRDLVRAAALIVAEIDRLDRIADR